MQNTRILTFLIVLFLLQMGNGQKLSHKLGEVIIEVREDKSIGALLTDLRVNNKYSSPIQAKQITQEPMNLWVLSINPNRENEIDFLRDVTYNQHVLQAQKNHITSLRVLPDDPLITQQWQYINTGQSGGTPGADLDMELAWDYTTGGLTPSGEEIVICIIDDGIVATNEDWGDNLWLNTAEIPDNNIDDDNNGYIDDYRGWHSTNENDNVYIDGGHGTRVTGIVGAQGNNNLGVSGVNWDVKMMIVDGGASNGEVSALAAYAYPYTMRKMYNESNGAAGAFVVATNASWGVDEGNPDEAPIWCEFYNLLGEEGIINVGATVNSNLDVEVSGDLPTGCTSDYLISVTNINDEDEKISGAGYGVRSIDLGAFGAGTYTVSGNSYGTFGGTSAATPHVTGMVGLLYALDCPAFHDLVSNNPGQAALQIKDHILFGVDANASLAGITTTGGRLNAHNTVLNFLEGCQTCTEAYGAFADDINIYDSKITWHDGGNVGVVDVRYRVLDSGTWTTANNVSSPYSIDGLDPCMQYEYQTKTTCNGSSEGFSYSKVFETDGCCETPRVTSVSVVNGVATVTWNEVSAASNFSADFRLAGTTDWATIDIGPTNTIQIPNIANCLSYELRLKSECDITSNESEYSDLIAINGDCGECTQEYCEFTVKNTEDEWINSVEIEGVFNNISGVSEMGYDHFLDQFGIELDAGNSYTLNVAQGYADDVFTEHFSAYIDFNQDGVFDTDEEEIYKSPSGTQDPFTTTFTVPENAAPGLTRMRIVMRFNAANGPCDNAGFEYGEVEDYCLNVKSNLDCPTDYTATVKDTTTSLLVFEIPQDDRVETYILEYRVKGTSNFITIPQATNVIAIVGLEECTYYEFRSSIVCNGLELIPSGIQEVRTKCLNSTDDPESKVNVSVYPNPSTGILTIEALSKINQVDFWTLDGRKVSSHTPRSSVETISMTPELSAGIYLLDVKTDNGRKLVKWVKMD